MAGKMKVSYLQVRHAVTDLEHPAWCDLSRCTAARGAVHASSPATVQVGDDTMLVMQLLQAVAQPDWAPPPFVQMEFHDDLDDANDGCRYALTAPLEHARALAAVLRSVAGLADL